MYSAHHCIIRNVYSLRHTSSKTFYDNFDVMRIVFLTALSVSCLLYLADLL